MKSNTRSEKMKDKRGKRKNLGWGDKRERRKIRLIWKRKKLERCFFGHYFS